VKRHNQYSVEAVEGLCQVSLSSHGMGVDPSSEAVAEEIVAMAEVLEEEHIRRLLMTDHDSVGVLEAAHNPTWRNYILVVVLEGSGTFQSVRRCAAVVVGRCSIGCWIAQVVGRVLVKKIIVPRP
jgi:hypothetical protein